MIALFEGLGVKRTRRLLYGLLAVSIAGIVAPGLGGLLSDRLLKEAPSQVDCAKEVEAVRAARIGLAGESMDRATADRTSDWLYLRERSVFMRRQCADGARGGEAIAEDDLVRRAVAAYRVWLKG